MKVDLDSIRNATIEQIRIHVIGAIVEGTYFKARGIARRLLEELYGINHMILRYEEIALNWTKKIAKILKEYEGEGYLEQYSKNNRSTLYKKIKEKEVKENE